MKHWSLIVLIISSFIACNVAFAEETVEITVTEASDKSAALARQEILDKAADRVSVQFIKEIIGDAKYDKNKDVIKNKILRQSSRYVLFMRGGTPRTQGSRTEMDVTLRVSRKNLQDLLLNQGLLYKMEGAPRILPMITMTDRVNSRAYSWWGTSSFEDRSFAITQLDRFHRSLQTKTRSKGFFALNPTAAPMNAAAPDAFRSDNPSKEDLMFLGEYFRTQIVVRGQILLMAIDNSNSFRIETKLSALHTGNGRIVGEVIRTYDTSPGVFQSVISEKLSEVSDQMADDLAVQLFEAWRSGTFGASLINLAVVGDLNYQQMQSFKSSLMSQVRDIKSLKERLFSPGRVTFEVDSSVNSRQLAEGLKSKRLDQFQVDVVSVRNDGLELRVVAK